MSKATTDTPQKSKSPTPAFPWIEQTNGLARLCAWFKEQGWTPAEFQLQTWKAYLAGQSGLVHAPTGSGKTLAVFGGPLADAVNQQASAKQAQEASPEPSPQGPRVIWLTPLRALATDTTQALQAAAGAMGLKWSVQLRTSDTSSTIRKKQKEKLPDVLVTTPESLSVLLSQADAPLKLGGTACVIVDEWHELLSTKRGVQTELCIARLKNWSKDLRLWGLSATLGNLSQAKDVLLGPDHSPAGALIHGHTQRIIQVDTLIPESIERFPWGGHLGMTMVESVCNELARGGSSLVFTNTRAQAEIWFSALMKARPQWLGELAIHHGSLDRAIRQEVENMLRAGKLRAVVCTSSLDLGVDFSAVDSVLQIGSPKGIARLMQRAGRSGHRPGQPSRVVCVATHAFELVEFSAAREGIEKKLVEERSPLIKPLDVLAQHVVTVAAGGGFFASELLAEIRQTHAYQSISDDEWGWVIDFATRGGPTLTAYPRYMRIRQQPDGRYVIASDQLARAHRLSIGTITSDGVVQLVGSNGKKLGTIEENFIGRLKPGDSFVFAGKVLELIGMRQMVARVRPATRKRGTFAQWAGGRFPLSTQLALGVRKKLKLAGEGIFADAEMKLIAPLMDIQKRWSVIPDENQLLIEQTSSREGHHVFIFPFAGRLVHEGLAAVLSYRIKQKSALPVTATFTDYGIELHLPSDPGFEESDWRHILSKQHLLEDLLTCLNAGELTKRTFRDISRVAGLITPTGPGQPKSTRQLQASSELFYDVFCEFDPQNLLLEQARREVLDKQLEFSRLTEALQKLESQTILLTQPKRFTPLAFPLWAQRIQSQTLRSESPNERIERMLKQLETSADS